MSIKKRSLEDLLKLLPVSINYKDQEVMFSLAKIATGYSCMAYETMEGNTVYADDAENEHLEFISQDPGNAVSMMYGWLRVKGYVEGEVLDIIKSPWEKLAELQDKVGYKRGEFNVVALLGLMGEAGEVAEEWMKQYEPYDAGQYYTTRHLLDIIRELRKVDAFKKEVRDRTKELTWPNSYLSKIDLEKFDREVSDALYYLNAIAIARGKTLEHYAEISFQKVSARMQQDISHGTVQEPKKEKPAFKQPENLEEAVDLLYKETAEYREKHQVTEENIDQALPHHGFGTSIRNGWHLWWSEDLAARAKEKDPDYPQERPALVKWFNDRNIFHADDMSGTIQAALKAKVAGEQFNFDHHIKRYFAHWKKHGFPDGIFKPENRK